MKNIFHRIVVFLFIFSLSQKLLALDYVGFVDKSNINSSPKNEDSSNINLPSEVKDGAYPVQVLLTISRDIAFQNREFLISKGHVGAYIKVKKASDNSTVYYRVYSGNYPTATGANNIAKAIREKYKQYNNAFTPNNSKSTSK